ncbi:MULTISPECIES: glycosyltransferase family 2 protein [unclassified Dietzia]|uniref:glycosyltransferase family 2 protein n=1 Tax=unclassified Dietzia TaxID=2617939 RepID=UPI0018D225B3|nr:MULTISPECIES: glycosyltransferase [unclassified Dietzia]
MSGNRTGVAPAAGSRMRADVVIPYYRGQRMLDRILAALDRQTGLALPPRVIVADDGSPTPPAVPPGVTVVRQDDRGFRASAARHLGASAGDGEVIVFLDGDTVPAPGYVAALLAALDQNPDLLVVGRRRYGRFAGTDVSEPAEILPDPAWPSAFYRETDDLTREDGGWHAGRWRGVLSAVCGLHRRLYDLSGGFDPRIVGYGGEDWDLAWRCEQAGGRLRHVPGAVAWHDGPDWSGRGEDDPGHVAQKNAETARLARLIVSPLTRPSGGIFEVPLVAVHVHAGQRGSGADAAACASLVRWGDVSVTVDPATSDAAEIAELFGADPRVRLASRHRWWEPAPQGAGPRRRPEVLIDLLRPCALGALDPGRLRALCPPVGMLTLDDDEGRVLALIRTSRALAREHFWGDRPGDPVAIRATDLGVTCFPADDAGVRLERILGGW